MLVAIRNHRTAAIPLPLADNVHSGCQEGVGVANHRTDVEVVLPILDRNVEGVPA